MADKKDFSFNKGQGQQATPDNAPDRKVAEDDGYLKDTLDWCFANMETDSTGNRPCPWCANNFFFGDEAEFERTIHNHWLEKHRAHLEMTHFNPEMGWDAYAIMSELKKLKDDQEEAKAKKGLDVLDELDSYDILYLPEEMRRRARVEGGKFHWAKPDRVQRYKDQGMQVVNTDDPKWNMNKGEMKHQHSHEDSTVRANEMIAVYVPPILNTRRDKFRRAKAAAQGNPASSREAQQREVGDVGKRAYEYYKNTKNSTHDEAMRMARRVEDSVAAGQAPMPLREPNERSIVHKRR